MIKHVGWQYLISLLSILPVLNLTAQQDPLKWYAGDTHIHTSIHAVSSISERVEEGVAGGLDWLAITRHKRSGAFWKAHEVDREYEKHFPQIAPILGMEWDSPPELDQEDIIILGVNRNSPIPEDNLQSIIDWTNRERGVFIFANPSQDVFDHIDKWRDYIAFEGHSGTRWNPACEPGSAWDILLSSGKRMFIVGANDNQGQKYLDNRIVKTWVLAPSNAPRDIIEGIRNGRVYVSERAEVTLDFRVDGKHIGGTVVNDGSILPVSLSAKADMPITRIQLISNGYPIWTVTPKKPQFNQQFRLQIMPTMRYVRVIVETADSKTMGNPVFIEQEGDIKKSIADKPNPHPVAEWRNRLQTESSTPYELRDILRVYLQDDDPRVRMNAAYAMVELDLPNTREALFTLAGDSLSEVRAYATRLLAGRVTPEDIDNIKPLLNDSDPQVRLWAVRAVEFSGVSEKRSLLLDMYDDSFSWVRFASMEGLLDIAQEDESVFDDLKAMVENGNIRAADPFNRAPQGKKNEMIDYLRGKYGKKRDSALYMALERLGVSPANAYSINIMSTRNPPVIDANLDEALWKQVPRTFMLDQDDVAEYTDHATSVLVTHDEDALYVAFKCPVLPDSTINPQKIEYVMIGFDTNHNGGIDYTFELDQNGQVLGMKDGITPWKAPVEFESTITRDQWIVEVAIPYSSIEWLAPVWGKTWGFNLGHGIRGQNTRLNTWAPTLGQLSNANRYGNLVFDKKRSDITK